MKLEQYLDFAKALAWDAGRLTLGYFQAGVRPTFKADDTPVTVADKAAEDLIRGRIETHFPDHAIVGEEGQDKETAGATHRWFIDPIDGTKSFVRGVPLYGVLLGLEIEGSVAVGVVHFPALNEMVAAADGLGCTWNGRPARVSAERDLSRAFFCHTDSAAFAHFGRGPAWERLQAAAYYNPGWGDAYGHALVATGRIEAMFDPIMNVWDCAPFPPILREAGGYFGDWRGNETIHGAEALSTTPALLPQILALIN